MPRRIGQLSDSNVDRGELALLEGLIDSLRPSTLRSALAALASEIRAGRTVFIYGMEPAEPEMYPQRSANVPSTEPQQQHMRILGPDRQTLLGRGEDRMATRLIREARDLRSETGENPEYDRALVELVGRCMGLSASEEQHRTLLKYALGILQG